MKNLLYIISMLLFVIWGILYFGFETSENVNILLVVAGMVILARIIFDKKL